MRWHQERATDSVAFEVHVDADGPRPVVTVRGDIDLDSVGRFAAGLDTAIAKCEGAGTGIELDVGDVTFMGSTGLTALIAAHQRLGQVPEAIVLRNPSAALRRLLDVAGVGDLFTLSETDPRRTSSDAAAEPSDPPG